MYTVLNTTGDITHCGNMGHVIGDFSKACFLARKYNFDGINIDLNSDSTSLAQKKELLEKYHLIPAAYGSPLRLYDSDTNEEFEQSLRVLEKEAKSLKYLGCKIILCYLPPFSEHLNFNANFNLMSERLRRIKPILEENGLKFALEFIGPTETRVHTKYDFIHTIDGVRCLIASSGLDGFAGFKLDVHHWANSGAGLLDLKHLEVDSILYVELNDGLEGYDLFSMPEFTRELPMKTHVTAVSSFLCELIRKNYIGPICVEPWNEEIKKMPLEDAIQIVKKSLDVCLSTQH